MANTWSKIGEVLNYAVILDLNGRFRNSLVYSFIRSSINLSIRLLILHVFTCLLIYSVIDFCLFFIRLVNWSNKFRSFSFPRLFSPFF